MYFLREKVISGTQLPQETSLDSQICGPVLSLTPLEQSRDRPPCPSQVHGHVWSQPPIYLCMNRSMNEIFLLSSELQPHG